MKYILYETGKYIWNLSQSILYKLGFKKSRDFAASYNY